MKIRAGVVGCLILMVLTETAVRAEPSKPEAAKLTVSDRLAGVGTVSAAVALVALNRAEKLAKQPMKTLISPTGFPRATTVDHINEILDESVPGDELHLTVEHRGETARLKTIKKLEERIAALKTEAKTIRPNVAAWSDLSAKLAVVEEDIARLTKGLTTLKAFRMPNETVVLEITEATISKAEAGLEILRNRSRLISMTRNEGRLATRGAALEKVGSVGAVVGLLAAVGATVGVVADVITDYLGFGEAKASERQDKPATAVSDREPPLVGGAGASAAR